MPRTCASHHKHQVVHLLNKETIVIQSELASTGNVAAKQGNVADTGNVAAKQGKLTSTGNVVAPQELVASTGNVVNSQEQGNVAAILDNLANTNTCAVTPKTASDQLKPIPTSATTNALADKQLTSTGNVVAPQELVANKQTINNSPLLTCQNYQIQ